ncbi:MAG: amidohydrolase, partial [Chloroflexota bacterium]
VGSDAEAVSYINEETLVIDGEGKTLLPGLIDTHYHLLWGSYSLYGAQLQGVESLEGVQEALIRWAAEHPDAPVVLGEGLSYAVPDQQTPLTRQVLDQIISDRPLVLTAFDQHSCFANTMALEMAGILQGPSTPLSNGEIVIGPDRLATGELYEMDAMSAIKAIVPKLSAEAERQVLREGLQLAASYGITSIHNMDGNLHQAELYAALEEAGELSLRIYMPFWVKPEMSSAEMLTQTAAIIDALKGEMVRGGVVKFFMDGVYESHTAVSVNGFADKPGEHGEPIWEAGRYAEFVTLADAKGYQLVTHAVGDGAVRRVLDGYEQAQKVNGDRDSRHRVEHIELIQASDILRFAELGVIASMQPLHAAIGGEIWFKRIDAAEYDRGFPWRTLRKADAHLVFGSDWPVVTCNPYLSFAEALLRQPWTESGINHSQTLAETIRAYTKDAAWAEFQEGIKGEIREGLLADLALLSHDIFSMNPEQLVDVSAILTVCNGRIVYKA